MLLWAFCCKFSFFDTIKLWSAFRSVNVKELFKLRIDHHSLQRQNQRFEPL